MSLLAALVALAIAAVPPDVEHAHVWQRVGGPKDCGPAATLTALTLLGLRDPRRDPRPDLLEARWTMGAPPEEGTSFSRVPEVVERWGGRATWVPYPSVDDVRELVERGRVVLLAADGHVVVVADHDSREERPWVVSDPGRERPKRVRDRWVARYAREGRAIAVEAHVLGVAQTTGPRDLALTLVFSLAIFGPALWLGSVRLYGDD